MLEINLRLCKDARFGFPMCVFAHLDSKKNIQHTIFKYTRKKSKIQFGRVSGFKFVVPFNVFCLRRAFTVKDRLSSHSCTFSE